MNLLAKIEAVLFYLNEPIKIKQLAKILDEKESEIFELLQNLEGEYEERGLRIVTNGEIVTLATNPDLAEVIEKLAKEEENKPLTRAILETLSIILYKGEITKHELDEIRGVNSSFSLRNLRIRGLVEKKENKKDKRSPLYIPSTDTLAYLGVSKVEELEEFEMVKEKLEEIMNP